MEQRIHFQQCGIRRMPAAKAIDTRTHFAQPIPSRVEAELKELTQPFFLLLGRQIAHRDLVQKNALREAQFIGNTAAVAAVLQRLLELPDERDAARAPVMHARYARALRQ